MRRSVSNARESDDAALAASDWLCLAAAPTFAIMALLSALSESGRPDAFCATAQDGPLSAMVLMYVLMSAFHSAPWLKLIRDRRSEARRCRADVSSPDAPKRRESREALDHPPSLPSPPPGGDGRAGKRLQPVGER